MLSRGTYIILLAGETYSFVLILVPVMFRCNKKLYRNYDCVASHFHCCGQFCAQNGILYFVLNSNLPIHVPSFQLSSISLPHLIFYLKKQKWRLDHSKVNMKTLLFYLVVHFCRPCIQLVQFISEFMTSNSAGSSHFSHLVQKWKMWMTHMQPWL